MSSSLQLPTLIKRRWRRTTRIGGGSFGEIYCGEDTLMESPNVAIKLEKQTSKYPQLIHEAKIFTVLQNQVGVPVIYWYGSEGGWNILVMELLGPSLEDVFTCCHKSLPIKSILMITDQMLSRIEMVHNNQFLHRDIKPDNFLAGIQGSKRDVIHIIDFGLAKRYVDSKGNHIPFRSGKNLTGTARYASINTHLGYEQGRRDDLEGMLYVTLFFLRGSLPWQGLQANKKDNKYKRIMAVKMNCPLDDLCSNLPREIYTMLAYIRKLRHDSKPDYEGMRQMIRKALLDLGVDIKKDPSMRAWNSRSSSRQKVKLHVKKDEVNEEYDENMYRQKTVSVNKITDRLVDRHRSLDTDNKNDHKFRARRWLRKTLQF